MIKLMTIVAVVLSISFNTSQPLPQTQFQKTERENLEEITILHEDYTLNISIEKANSSNPVLVIAMELKNNAHFISPFEKKDFSGKFHFDLGSYKDLAFEGEVSESPKTVAKVLYPNYTSNIEGNLWVTENTIYKQSLKLKNTKDFEVFGRIQFTIEPSCTFEEIPFSISRKNGKMIVTEPKC